ncbi:MAG: hypothetical protein M1834_005794 [Cirrosporium novae-zelandiae]|nr:MAG: hypothetical protein M1834_005794 [Cirrosporium novae-zelandiae]
MYTPPPNSTPTGGGPSYFHAWAQRGHRYSEYSDYSERTSHSAGSLPTSSDSNISPKTESPPLLLARERRRRRDLRSSDAPREFFSAVGSITEEIRVPSLVVTPPQATPPREPQNSRKPSVARKVLDAIRIRSGSDSSKSDGSRHGSSKRRHSRTSMDIVKAGKQDVEYGQKKSPKTSIFSPFIAMKPPPKERRESLPYVQQYDYPIETESPKPKTPSPALRKQGSRRPPLYHRLRTLLQTNTRKYSSDDNLGRANTGSKTNILLHKAATILRNYDQDRSPAPSSLSTVTTTSRRSQIFGRNAGIHASTTSSIRDLKSGNPPVNTPDEDEYCQGSTRNFMRFEMTSPNSPVYLPSEAQEVEF